MHVLLKIACAVGKFLILPVGVLLLLGAAYLTWSTSAWLARSVAAQGSVVEMIQIRDRDTGSVSFSPLVKFQTAEGKPVEFQSTFQSNPPAYSTGQTVTVLYDPAEPNSAAIQGLFTVWGVPMILGAIGAVFLALGIVAVLVGNRFLRQPAPGRQSIA